MSKPEFREIHIGDVVQHFKREMCTDEELIRNQYLYKVIAFATHTETNEPLVIYQALYSPFKTFARPECMFYSKVDKNKYPNIKQEYRLEIVKN